ncbi:type IV pilus biogenesis protein CpaD/CtpE [Novosphingobium hassiacum]|uniref:Type IV pilus biogenesis protein CpaD/CtpE n=1 Tax=Novosphingobium hassiacum TaxID=173676 RepID=A0A7W6EXP2_9SPHN|nr:type IV pilus biogenesis protein CpaD/CtpE [Novosphingobium hassiacum]
MQNRRIVLIGCAALFLAGCASKMAFRGPIALASDQQIMIVRATAKFKQNGILVSGDIRRTNGYAGSVAGHLHIEGLGAQGEVLVKADAPWGEFMSRRFRLAYFKAFLETPSVSSITSIRVTSVTGSP